MQSEGPVQGRETGFIFSKEKQFPPPSSTLTASPPPPGKIAAITPVVNDLRSAYETDEHDKIDKGMVVLDRKRQVSCRLVPRTCLLSCVHYVGFSRKSLPVMTTKEGCPAYHQRGLSGIPFNE